MSIRTVLVPLNGVDRGAEALELGFEIGRGFDARVTVLHADPDPRASLPYLGEGMTGAMVEEVAAAVERDIAERAARARQEFEAVATAAGVTPVQAPGGPGFAVTWRSVTGREEDVVATEGRLADLLVLPRPKGEDEVGGAISVHAALLDTGRPLLLAPPQRPERIAAAVAIAWNGSAESARAVSAALPLLGMAGKVTVLAAEADEQRGPGGKALAAYLGAHGIEARVKALKIGRQGAGEALLLAARSAGADLLVMGAYTHSRLRQLVFGGATRFVLANAPLPVLLMH